MSNSMNDTVVKKSSKAIVCLFVIIAVLFFILGYQFWLIYDINKNLEKLVTNSQATVNTHSPKPVQQHSQTNIHGITRGPMYEPFIQMHHIHQQIDKIFSNTMQQFFSGNHSSPSLTSTISS